MERTHPEAWKRFDELKEKYKGESEKKEPAKILSAKQTLKELIENNVIGGGVGEDKNIVEEMIASLVVVGSLRFGCYKKSKEKIISWINEVIDMTPKKQQSYFNSCWRNLEKNGVFKKGKIYANFDGESDGVEFALLICIAQGYVERTVSHK